jgi:hypothetical protein
MLFGLIAVVLFGIVLLLLKLKSPSFMMRSFLVTLFGFLAIAPMQTVGATATFKIANTSLTGYAKSPVLVRTSGGAGSGAVTFSATGAHCSVNSHGVLVASAATTCSVKATKAASSGAGAATSAIVGFVFRTASTTLHISNSVLTGQANVNFQVTSAGAVGSGAISYDTTGGACAINPATGLLVAYAMGSCPVTVAQAASGSHRAATSPVVVFYFGVGPQDPLGVATVLAVIVPTATATVYTTGGSGTGAVTYSLDTAQSNGSQCAVNASTGDVTDTGHVDLVNCWVTATKAASDGYLSATATSSVEITFNSAAGGGSASASFATPDKAFLTSITSNSTAVTAVDDTTQGYAWFIDSYFSHPDHWLKYYVTGGSTVVMTWHVTDFSGTALPNKAVTLISNLGYSCSHGVTWSETALNPAPAICKSGTPFGSLAGTTDSNGDVTFTLHNTNATSVNSTGDMTLAGSRLAETVDNWSRFVLKIGSEVFTANPNTTVNQATDLIDIIMLP